MNAKVLLPLAAEFPFKQRGEVSNVVQCTNYLHHMRKTFGHKSGDRLPGKKFPDENQSQRIFRIAKLWFACLGF